jgi:hypothetical protein
MDLYDWDWASADKEYQRAIALNPGYATAHHWYAWHLIVMGRNREGIFELRKAESLDPLSLIISADLAVPSCCDRPLIRSGPTLGFRNFCAASGSLDRSPCAHIDPIATDEQIAADASRTLRGLMAERRRKPGHALLEKIDEPGPSPGEGITRNQTNNPMQKQCCLASMRYLLHVLARAFIARSKAESSRRRAIASAV